MIALVYDEFITRGLISDPADGIGGDDDLSFWATIDERLAALDRQRAFLNRLADPARDGP